MLEKTVLYGAEADMDGIELANFKTELSEAKTAMHHVGIAVAVAAERIHEVQVELAENRITQRQQDGEIADLIRKVTSLENQFSLLMNRIEKYLAGNEYRDRSLVSFQEPYNSS